MFGLKVPIISIVIGEGGSGGALAIGCANKLLMLENAVFYVARDLLLVLGGIDICLKIDEDKRSNMSIQHIFFHIKFAALSL
ncbi:acetyl-coenzyme A carboxylase carboxyl transferase subunit alpha, chloroplastic-like [Camellia sinensis]|uniref:acetyl-coenzyme A carboxylase carboxyl transferase subunit alpha, chloroplastic-like n=1 Tax=Camellia sinensis TaxID=4442 RepID=UPI0010364026|nr:acetyl-coenzyme A carboxylase carboxyl transferase subunit alpha, chloroplastic-like [Camellia sinensis]